MADNIKDIFGVEEAIKEYQRRYGGKRRRKHNEETFHRGSIRGAKLVEEKLLALGEDVLTAAKLALREGVDEIVTDAKSRCPVKTGKLRDSIKATGIENGMAYYLTADATNENNVAYGQFVEFSPKINKAFLYPAIEAHISNLKRDIRQAIQYAIKG